MEVVITFIVPFYVCYPFFVCLFIVVFNGWGVTSVMLLFAWYHLIVDVFPTVYVCYPDLFSFYRLMTFEDRHTTVAFIFNKKQKVSYMYIQINLKLNLYLLQVFVCNHIPIINHTIIYFFKCFFFFFFFFLTIYTSRLVSTEQNPNFRYLLSFVNKYVYIVSI